jgi:thymidylate synthase (FAD)
MKLIKPSFQIIPQEDLMKHIELCGRICYKSENKITDDSAERFVNGLIKSGHTSVLEHGTVYLDFTNDWQRGRNRYTNNPYSKVYKNTLENGWGAPHLYVTTNYRTIIKNNWLNDLKYICEPTEFHEKRATVKFICDRGILQEFRTHRIFARDDDDNYICDIIDFSSSAESTRYCNYSKDKFGDELTFIIPCWFENKDNILEKWNGFKLGQWKSIEKDVKPKLFYEPYSVEDMYERVWILNCIQSEENYKMLLTDHKIEMDRGPWTPQQARTVLPNSLKTELVMTGFVSDWKHFFGLRCAPSAHPQARELAIPLEEEFKSLNLI